VLKPPQSRRFASFANAGSKLFNLTSGGCKNSLTNISLALLCLPVQHCYG
jgi:hypothetical protein